VTRVGFAVHRTFHAVSHSRNFRLFFIGQAVSVTGTWMQSVASAWLVLQLTGSGVALGVQAALNFGPVLVLGPWGGLLADRHDKRAILVATLAAVSRDLDRRVAAAQARGPRDPAARLRALVRACLEVAAGRPEFWVVFLEFWGEMTHDRRLRRVNADVYARTRRLLGRLIADGVRSGRFRAVEPGRAAAVVLGLVDGVSLQLTFDPAAFGVPEAARFCDEALARYLFREDRR